MFLLWCIVWLRVLWYFFWVGFVSIRITWWYCSISYCHVQTVKHMDLKSPQEIPPLVYLASEATWSPAETEAPKVTEAMTSCPQLMAGAAKLLAQSQTLCHHFIHRTAAVLFWFLCLLTQLLTLHDRWGPGLVALKITPLLLHHMEGH